MLLLCWVYSYARVISAFLRLAIRPFRIHQSLTLKKRVSGRPPIAGTTRTWPATRFFTITLWRRRNGRIVSRIYRLASQSRMYTQQSSSFYCDVSVDSGNQSMWDLLLSSLHTVEDSASKRVRSHLLARFSHLWHVKDRFSHLNVTRFSPPQAFATSYLSLNEECAADGHLVHWASSDMVV